MAQRGASGWQTADWSLLVFVVFGAEHETSARWSRDRAKLLRAVRIIKHVNHSRHTSPCLYCYPEAAVFWPQVATVTLACRTRILNTAFQHRDRDSASRRRDGT